MNLREMGAVTVGVEAFDRTEIGERAIHRGRTIVRPIRRYNRK